jgi:hypothetical protein
MIEYRLTTSKKPNLRLTKIDEDRRTTLAEIEGPRATLLKRKIIPTLQLESFYTWRDGRTAYTVEEESALRLFIAMRMIIGVRDENRIEKLSKQRGQWIEARS